MVFPASLRDDPAIATRGDAAMSTWNAMTYEGKETILHVVQREAERFFSLASKPAAWERPTRSCPGWTTRDVVGHIVDTTEGYFAAFDAARGGVAAPDPHGLANMSRLVDERATAFRGVPQAEMIERLETDFQKMMGILEPLGPEDWTGLMVTHSYMGPVPAFFYAAGQLMDYGVHSWDLRQGLGIGHGLPGDAADLLVPFMFAVWQGTVRTDAAAEPCEIGIRVGGRNAGDYVVRVDSGGLSYEPADVEALPTYVEFDAGSFVLTAFGRINGGTVRGDLPTAERFLSSFFRI
jgi:uncharacterized protein (TIGR03083 family)